MSADPLAAKQAAALPRAEQPAAEQRAADPHLAGLASSDRFFGDPLLDAPGTLVMGVLNVTPDSFSDGGQFVETAAALQHARELVLQGAHVIDVGGESTRPGADRVTPEEEQRRVLPIVESLAAEGIVVSIDTVHAETARRAVAAGARIINDVSGATADPDMLRVAADTGAYLVLMHWRGIPDPAHSRSQYVDVVAEVRDELVQLAQRAIDAGVARDRVILDPGLGFDKTAAQGWQLLAGLDRLTNLGYPLLIGVSRKRMLGETLGGDATMADRDIATATVSALSAQAGAWAVRVHDVAATSTALKVAEAWNDAAVPAPGSDRTSATPVPADRITLTGLEVFAHHGVFDFEREQGQKFLIDAEVAVDLRAASAGDDLAQTVHYGELAGAILLAAKDDPVDLIETLAERVANVALGFAAVREARITVHKPSAPIDATFGDVSVTIVRERTSR